MRRRLQTPAAALIALVVSLYILSIPAFTNTLLLHLEIFPAIPASDLANPAALERLKQSADAIVVLSAGIRHIAPEYGGPSLDALALERVRYGAFLARATGLPLLVSGGLILPERAFSHADIMAATLEHDFGVRARWREGQSRNTAENAIFSSKILEAAHLHRILLVTHAWHMRRAKAAFEANHIDVIPAPTVFASDPTRSLLRGLRPRLAVLRMTGYALHEWIGLLWYRIHYGYGWQ